MINPREAQEAQAARNAHVDKERDAIQRQQLHATRWLLWAIGPYFLTLPEHLGEDPHQGVYELRWSPNERTIQSKEFYQNHVIPVDSAYQRIDTDVKYVPWVTLSFAWGPEKLPNRYDSRQNRLRRQITLGVLPFITHATDSSYSLMYHLALINPDYHQAGIYDYAHVLPDAKCQGLFRTRDQDRSGEFMLVFPTPTWFHQGEYRQTQAALTFIMERSALQWAIRHRTPIPKLSDTEGQLFLSPEVLKKCVTFLHSKPGKDPDSEIGRLLTRTG